MQPASLFRHTSAMDDFKADGFVGPVAVFTAEECGWLMRLLQDEAAIPAADWYKGHAVSSRLFFEIASRPAILDCVENLLGPNVMLWGAGVLRRSPGAVHPWHTDIETAAEDGQTVSVWIGLEHTTQSSALQLVSGSHRFGHTVQQTVAEMEKRRGEIGDEEIMRRACEYDTSSRLVKPDMTNGDALFFDGRLWHGSHNENKSSSRTALLLQYASPDTVIRIPDLSSFEFPIRFIAAPKPPCIMLRGTDHHGVNRIVSAPAPAPITGGLPILSTCARTLELPLKDDAEKGWKPHGIFHGATGLMSEIACHASVLSPGVSPHPLHQHLEEEILILLDGEVDLILNSATGQPTKETEKRHRLAPGEFVYYSAFQWHTLKNSGEKNATYLMLKWKAEKNSGANRQSELETILVSNGDQTLRETGYEGFQIANLLHGPTRHLRKLHCHLTHLQPGAGYPAHIDAYDVAIITLQGTVETLGTQFGPNSAIFYAAGESHGMKSVGDKPALYMVFEFHGDALQRSWAKHPEVGRAGRAAKKILRRILKPGN